MLPGIALLLLVPALAGCLYRGDSAMDVLALDPVTTSSITPVATPVSVGAELQSDEKAIERSLASMALDTPLPWANPQTGSNGVITSFSESPGNGMPCRNFRTTRHAYDGIAIFAGRVCQTPGMKWQVTRLQRAEN